MQERVPAQNIEAEQSVLSAILIDNNVMNKVTEILKAQDFYRIVHQIIYQTMLDMHAKHQPIDMITLIEELKNRNKLEDVGGVSYITLLANIVPTSANALYHARIVVNNALLRQLGESGAAITALSFEKEEDIQSLIDRAEQTLHSVSLRKHGKAFVPIHDILTHTMDRMTNLQTGGTTVTGLSTGFADLDRLTTGLHPSDFIILAARPSMGKTALALNIAQNVAIRGEKQNEAPKRVAFFSLEMSSDQLVQRMLCTEADTDLKTLAAGSGTGVHSDCPQPDNWKQQISQNSHNSSAPDNSFAQWNRLWEAAAKLDEAHIFIDDTPGLSILDLRSRSRRLQAEGGLDFIAGLYRHRLPAADAGQPQPQSQRQPAARSDRNQPGLKSPGPGTAGAGAGPLPVKPQRRTAPEQTAHAQRPAGIRLSGTGRGHRHVPVPGRLLQRSRRHPQPHYGTDRSQTPQRPHRTGDAVL